MRKAKKTVKTVILIIRKQREMRSRNCSHERSVMTAGKSNIGFIGGDVERSPDRSRKRDKTVAENIARSASHGIQQQPPGAAAPNVGRGQQLPPAAAVAPNVGRGQQLPPAAAAAKPIVRAQHIQPHILVLHNLFNFVTGVLRSGATIRTYETVAGYVTTYAVQGS